MIGTYRLKLVIAYDGSSFEGWQSQAGGNTIQDCLGTAAERIAGYPIVIHGSGRTDAGVHAMGQVAHLDVGRMTPREWMRALNGNLPETIRVVRATRAKRDFHARFSAVGKVYRYSLWNASYVHPLYRGRVWHVPAKLDIGKIEAATKILTGTHDFRGFSANRGKPDENTIRTIKAIRLRRAGELLELTFEGDGFLYKMVRLLTGSIVRVGQGRAELGWLKDILDRKVNCNYAAPALGLCLLRVRYS